MVDADAILACVPRLVWFACVGLVLAAFYLWMNVAPGSEDNFGNIFFAGLVLIVIAAALAKAYQRPEPK